MNRIIVLLSALAVAAVAGCKPAGAPSGSEGSVPSAGGDWLTSLPQALAQAGQEKKLVLVDFNGSDWCPPCMQLKKDVFSSAEFRAFARQNLVLVDVDFPQRKAQSAELKAANEALSKQFKIEGFPTILVLDASGKELNRDVGYDGEGAAAYVARLSKLRN
jgi:thiol:disulfide interchange protein